MTESQPDQSEQAQQANKLYEAKQLAKLAGFLYEIFYGEISGKDGADWALDDLSDYCVAVSRRDPEMGQILVETFESTNPGDSPSLRAAVGSQNISDHLRTELGLPDRHAEPGPSETGTPAAVPPTGH